MAKSQNEKESIITKIINLFRNIISPKDKLLENKEGVEDNIAINLTQRETAKFNASIKVIKNAIRSIKE